MRFISFVAFLFVATLSAAQAQEIQYQPNPDTPIGTRNPNAPPETAQYDFVIGDWEVVINFRDGGGNDTTYNARWHNSWIVGGYAVMQEWRGPYASGSEVRIYNAQAGEWEGFNVYNGWGAPKRATAHFADGEMVVMIEPVTDASGTFINRETYTNIADDRWEMYSERSYDGGETWVRGAYDLVATRVE
jgi:hypothetical protein